MTPSGRESDNDVLSYMDGVPVKISESYRPPRKVTLPVGFQHRLETTLESTLRDSSFDFSLCRKVLEDAQTSRERKAAIRISRNSRLAAEEEKRNSEHDREIADQIEKFTLQSESQIESEAIGPSLASPPTSPAPIQTKVVAKQSDFSSILTPLPMPAPTKINSPIIPDKNAFNISDFEADTSSPFDNMELKTINEMEELAHVLQPNCTSDTRPKDNYQYSNYYSQSNVTSNNLPGNEQSNTKSVNVYGAFSNTASSVQNSESLINGPSFSNNQQNYSFPSQQPCNYYYPNQQTWGYSAQNSAYPFVPPNFNSQPKNYMYPIGNQAYSQASATYTNTLTHSTTTDHSLKGRTSKSVPDIMEELQRETLSDSSCSTAVPVPRVQPLPFDHLPTPRPASIGSTGLENWKPWPELDSPSSIDSRDVSEAPAVTRASHDPLAKFPESTQRLARQLGEMGFPVTRITRACETVGDDHKKVLDYLLQIQALEERGFPGAQVEIAIGKLGLDEAKALKFLPAFGQLVDLGFPEDKASQALLKADYDRDKALDALLS